VTQHLAAALDARESLLNNLAAPVEGDIEMWKGFENHEDPDQIPD
jgi:hypothetical protein